MQRARDCYIMYCREKTPQKKNGTTFYVRCRGYEDGVKIRADLIIQMNDLNKAHVIDFTFVEPTSQT